MSLRFLELVGTDPRKWGEQHGETLRDDIRQIVDIRLTLTLSKTDLGTEQNVLALASHHLPVLERFDRALHDELCGIARGAGLSPAHIVVANHYTDLRDLHLRDLEALDRRNGAAAGGKGATDPGGCSAIFVDDRVGETGARVLGQTWDMHGSAEPFAVLLRVPGIPDGALVEKTSPAGIPQRGSTLVFSIAGCLGMTGLSSWGTALAINNLNSLDATVGAVWPAVVRKALRQQDAARMRDVILDAPIGSGRHYLLADDETVFGIETSGTRKKIIRAGGRAPYIHTNHCVDAEMAETCRILPGSTTTERYAGLEKLTGGARPQDARGVFDALASVGLPQHPSSPHEVATCGALVMDIGARHAIACAGIPGPDADAILVEVR